MAQMWTSKHGTQIDIEGLSPEQVKEIQTLANNRRGTQATELATQYRGAAAPAASASAAPQVNPGLQAAKDSLTQQVARGDIQQWQADAEYNRLAGLAAQTSPTVNPNTPLVTAADVLNTTSQAAQGGAVAGNLLTNANQVNPFGSQNVSVDPITGQPIVTQGLSQGNQNVVNGIQGSSVNASNVLGGLLSGGAFNNAVNAAGAQSGPSSELMDAIYGSLTKDTENQYKREREQAEQTLANRGIPIGSEAYSNYMKDLDTRYNDIRSNARNQAVQQGYNTSISQQGANTNSLNALTGTFNPLNSLSAGGYFNPNFQGFQSVGYNQPDVGQVFNTLTGHQIATEGNTSAMDIAKFNASQLKGGGGGGSGSSSAGRSPFNPGPVPGSS